MKKVKKIRNKELGNTTSSGNMVSGTPYTMHNRVSYTYDGVFYERLIGDAIEWYDYDDDQVCDDVIENIQYLNGEVIIITTFGRLDLIDLHDPSITDY